MKKENGEEAMSPESKAWHEKMESIRYKEKMWKKRGDKFKKIKWIFFSITLAILAIEVILLLLGHTELERVLSNFYWLMLVCGMLFSELSTHFTQLSTGHRIGARSALILVMDLYDDMDKNKKSPPEEEKETE